MLSRFLIVTPKPKYPYSRRGIELSVFFFFFKRRKERLNSKHKPSSNNRQTRFPSEITCTEDWPLHRSASPSPRDDLNGCDWTIHCIFQLSGSLFEESLLCTAADLDVDLGTESVGTYLSPVYTTGKWGILPLAFKMMKYFIKVNTRMAAACHFSRPQLNSKPHPVCLCRVFTLD